MKLMAHGQLWQVTSLNYDKDFARLVQLPFQKDKRTNKGKESDMRQMQRKSKRNVFGVRLRN